ncbi:hypothetical protein J1N35_035430 [Gossypium stocksii]|uniref:Uncharacterized protein n=1 Tax=Gossypium stocksii TaxID=47602 RepID=A0A9D3UUE9_9ROSI|nr:hypothetical protein J1N35_035430 [Gossypium stocksii]
MKVVYISNTSFIQTHAIEQRQGIGCLSHCYICYPEGAMAFEYPGELPAMSAEFNVVSYILVELNGSI